jgi:hypothetical protein
MPAPAPTTEQPDTSFDIRRMSSDELRAKALPMLDRGGLATELALAVLAIDARRTYGAGVVSREIH